MSVQVLKGFIWSHLVSAVRANSDPLSVLTGKTPASCERRLKRIPSFHPGTAFVEQIFSVSSFLVCTIELPKKRRKKAGVGEEEELR